MKVRETHLPGVGTRYGVRFEGGGELTVLVRNEGTREVYWRSEPDADSERLYSVTERQARKLAEIFDGTYFEPVDDDFEAAWDEAVIEWVALPPESPAIGRSIRDLGVRTRTGAIVIAVQRGPRTVSNPGAEFEFERGDVVVAVGTDDAHDALSALLAPDDADVD